MNLQYETIGGIAISLSAISIVGQIVLLPLLFEYNRNFQQHLQINTNSIKRTIESADAQMNQIYEYSNRIKRSNEWCELYEQGPPGHQGDEGETGPSGDDGADGIPGMDARDIMEEIENTCVICPQGEMGPEGPPGNAGIIGPKGDKGPPGLPGIDGHDGPIGMEGALGQKGTDGKPGPKGPCGKNATGGTGPAGPKGLPGPIGRSGPQGARGERNYTYGPPGPDGKKGFNGMNGLAGNMGIRGERGRPGERGADILFCPCPMETSETNQNVHATETAQLSSKRKMNFETKKSENSNYANGVIDESLKTDIHIIKQQSTSLEPSHQNQWNFKENSARKGMHENGEKKIIKKTLPYSNELNQSTASSIRLSNKAENKAETVQKESTQDTVDSEKSESERIIYQWDSKMKDDSRTKQPESEKKDIFKSDSIEELKTGKMNEAEKNKKKTLSNDGVKEQVPAIDQSENELSASTVQSEISNAGRRRFIYVTKRPLRVFQ